MSYLKVQQKNRQMSHKNLKRFSRAAMPREAYVMEFPAHRQMCKCHGKCTWIGVSEAADRPGPENLG